MINPFFRWIFKPASVNEDSIEGSEILRKQMVLYILSLLGIVFLLIMSSRLFSEKSYFYVFLNLSLACFLLVLFFLTRTGKYLQLYGTLATLILQFYFMFIFHSGAGNQMAFVWYYLFPLVSLFLLGLKLGSILSLSMIGLSALLNFNSDILPGIVPFSSHMFVRILLSYMGVFLFAFVFEQTRQSAQIKLEGMMKKLNELAIRDTLTGLYNRRYMDDVAFRILNQRSRSGSAIAFIMADLDYFKKYNDTYGHQGGDKLLEAFSNLLISLVRRQTDFVFRYGGEEFALLLTSTSREMAENLAEKIVAETANLPFSHSKNPHGKVTVSVGLVYVDSHREVKLHELISQADSALYEAKKSGRNRYVHKFK
ncbi:GGDEF domain-containing protein [uncultured Desulfobacter sp.]|uniref:GGDEF domain-containing protein n=1 Tax=uncultured Desulfobacter sp. TaxID=240139 RepID=UPI002AAB2BB5|nr:GGDEF domain-containing protein [uncultured Desulfobacter sp.]